MKQKILLMGFLVVFLIGLASAITISSVSISPNSVAPGQEFTLSIDLENNFDYYVNDVTVSLNLQNVPFAPKTTSEIFFSEIRDGRSKSADFELIADASAAASTYKIPAIITSTPDDGTNKTEIKNTFVSATVNAKPNFIITSESNLIKGQKNKLDIKITNTGLAKAKFLIVKISPSADYDILSSESIYIGDLNSDDSDTASFDVYTKTDSAISIPITIEYKDSENKDYSEINSIPVKAYSQKDAAALGLISTSKTGWYIGIIVVLVIIWLIWRRARKKKNNLGAR